MSRRVRDLTKDAPSNDNAGLASHFVELAHRKTRPGGVVAMVLPLSAVSGGSWSAVREQWCGRYTNTIVVTIAGSGQRRSLILRRHRHGGVSAHRAKERHRNSRSRAVFAVLNRQPSSALHGELVASEIRRAVAGGRVRRLEDRPGSAERRFGSAASTAAICSIVPLKANDATGHSSVLPTRHWRRRPTSSEHGRLFPLDDPNAAALTIPIVPIGENSGPRPCPPRHLLGQLRRRLSAAPSS